MIGSTEVFTATDEVNLPYVHKAKTNDLINKISVKSIFIKTCLFFREINFKIKINPFFSWKSISQKIFSISS